MKRIGIAANKIAKGNVVLYNVYVVVISILVAGFIFIIAGLTLLLPIILIFLLGKELSFLPAQSDLKYIFLVCISSLTAVMTLFTLFAIAANVKFLSQKRKNGTSSDQKPKH